MQYVCYDQRAKFYSLILIFSTLCVVHDKRYDRSRLRNILGQLGV